MKNKLLLLFIFFLFSFSTSNAQRYSLDVGLSYSAAFPASGIHLKFDSWFTDNFGAALEFENYFLPRVLDCLLLLVVITKKIKWVLFYLAWHVVLRILQKTLPQTSVLIVVMLIGLANSFLTLCFDNWSLLPHFIEII